MASIGITASIQRACSSQHITKKPSSAQARPARSLGTTNVVTPKVEGLKLAKKQDRFPFGPNDDPKVLGDDVRYSKNSDETRFYDERWKNGTWDLNMFVKQGRMDWDAVIVAGIHVIMCLLMIPKAKRRKFLEVHPEASTNEEAVLFRSSIIPWWAWILHSHLPETELLNGRAAMLGFFMSYIVDALTGLDVVGQTGNFICKGALFFTIIGVLIFRRKEDLENIRKLADEATFYDKQWQASWQNPDASKEQIRKNN